MFTEYPALSKTPIDNGHKGITM